MVMHNKKRVCEPCYKKIQEKIIKDKFTCFSCKIITDDERDLHVYGKNKNRFCMKCYKKEQQITFDRNRLCAFIAKLFGLDRPTGIMLRQIKEYKEKQNISYRNMYFALDYATNIKGYELNLKFGVAVIPAIHAEMLNYYADIKQKRESAKNFNPTKSIDVVRIKKPVFDDSYRQKKMIDMESLLK